MRRFRTLAWVSSASLVTVALSSCSSDETSSSSSSSSSSSTLGSGGSPSGAGGGGPDAGGAGGAAGGGLAGGGAGACADASVTIGATSNPRGGNAPALVRPSYDYAPTVLHDGNYRMWWCGGIAGDHVLYAEASSLDGPWHAHGSSTPDSYDDVLAPTGVVGDFDGAHTCDPSVIRVDGTYYLYYGGLGQDGTPENTTRIGLATSDDGFTWSRQNGGKPIVNPAMSLNGKPNQYGAGQPSAFFKDGAFYLSFTDTSAAGANPVNGAGQFVLRSKDATFQAGVEELGAAGFAPQPPSSTRTHSLTEAFSPDWTYAPAIGMYVMAVDGGGGVENLRFFDASFQLVQDVAFAADWAEGPGIVKRPDGQLDPVAACDRVGVDLMRAVGPDIDSWNLAHSGIDVATGTTCDCLPWPSVLEGTLLVSSGKPLTLVRGGTRLQFALGAPAARLARTSLEVDDATFSAVPFGASMPEGATVVGATDRPAAFELDGMTLWPTSCLEIITDNGSSIQTITTAEFDALPQGPSLFCVK